MKVIESNLITSASADSENASFPASNLLDVHPKNTYEAASGVYVATLTLSLSAGSSGIFIGNTNAQAATIVISDPNEAELFNDTVFFNDTEWMATVPGYEVIAGQIGNAYGLFAEYAYTIVPLVIEITLTSRSDETLYAGIADAGKVLSFASPGYGAEIIPIEPTSIITPLDNGGEYYNRGDYIKQFSGLAKLEDDKWEEFDDFVRANGFCARPWQFRNNKGARWSTYARFIDLPASVFEDLDSTTMSIGLRETL